MNDIEIWKPYPDYPWIEGSLFGEIRTKDRYVTYKDGRKRLVKGQVLKQLRGKNGYMYVNFGVNGKHVNLLVHRIIASCFISNPIGLPEVNHINCDTTNNRLDNLEWCTGEYNRQYREEHGEALKRPVFAINLETQEVLQFESQSEAARQLGANQGHIKDVIKGKQNKHHGYWFTNADNHVVENVRAKFSDSIARKVEELLNKED